MGAIKNALGIEKTFNLIDMIESNPCIWNPRDENFSKKDYRLNALMKIATTMGLTVEETEAHWRSLRSSFGRQLKKIGESSPNCTGSDEVYTPRWIYYKKLKFLLEIIQPRRSTAYMGKHVTSNVCISDSESTPFYSSRLESHQTFGPKIESNSNYPTEFYESREGYFTDYDRSIGDADSTPSGIHSFTISSSPMAILPCDYNDITLSTSKNITRPIIRPTSTNSHSYSNMVQPTSSCSTSDSGSNVVIGCKKRKIEPQVENQLCTKKCESVSSSFGNWVGMVLQELPRAAQLETMHKISNLLHDIQVEHL